MTALDNVTIVALFVRLPVPGRVKTRLAQDLGEYGACELYKAMVADILENIRVSGLRMYLFHDGKDSREVPREWLEASGRAIVQQGESIGERMAEAFRYCFAENVDQVIVVGSDIPGLDSSKLLAASLALKTRDVAIAPAADGGYCLIAMKRTSFSLKIFQDIPWSTEAVFRDTLARCDELRMEVELLDVLLDIDTIDDLNAYRQNRSSSAYATNRWIEKAESGSMIIG
jgi:uncharacterized protein